MRQAIGVLASDDFEGRRAGTPGADKAAAYIADRFRRAGLKSPAGGFRQPFTIDRKPKDLPAASAQMPSGQLYFLEQLNKQGPFTAYNVVGRVPGKASDGRVVVVMAHYDHLGICEPEGAPDRICNGAVDNASGVAALIAVAERVAKMGLDRDVWLVATSGEEWGLLGAKAFAANPPVPLTSIVAGFNLDTIAIAPKGAPVAIVAPDKSPLEQLVRDAAKAVGRPFDPDREAQPFIKRQDGWALAERGVPMIMAGGSFSDLKLLEAFFGSAYHGPKDELRLDTDLGGAVDDANLHVELVRRAASRSLLPTFAQVPHLEK
ncbi:M20/M25/M40 family metallo-hydrolase [Sphingomonas alba]|uniref:M28 family peptidase n=1 Tax=Sphingomonas alba TaxID=2908208 RepID=A0ABT0RJJ0_9SPHN|nr:M20/M25/M40 family metallo-hydrolase [Sphingomonas alba]MCL6682806.1 M28 family peptidase [Sphingomonas alba]